MLVNGSTATDFAAETAALGRDAVSVGVIVLDELKAWANCAEVVYLAFASVAIARITAFSTFSGTSLRTARSGFGVSVKRFAMIACGVAPLNGRSPVIIS